MVSGWAVAPPYSHLTCSSDAGQRGLEGPPLDGAVHPERLQGPALAAIGRAVGVTAELTTSRWGQGLSAAPFAVCCVTHSCLLHPHTAGVDLPFGGEHNERDNLGVSLGTELALSSQPTSQGHLLPLHRHPRLQGHPLAPPQTPQVSGPPCGPSTDTPSFRAPLWPLHRHPRFQGPPLARPQTPQVSGPPLPRP